MKRFIFIFFLSFRYFNIFKLNQKIKKYTQPKQKARVKVLSHVINLGVKFKSLNNFNGVMEVLCCLRSPPIARLTRTWSLLSPGLLFFLSLFLFFLFSHFSN